MNESQNAFVLGDSKKREASKVPDSCSSYLWRREWWELSLLSFHSSATTAISTCKARSGSLYSAHGMQKKKKTELKFGRSAQRGKKKATNENWGKIIGLFLLERKSFWGGRDFLPGHEEVNMGKAWESWCLRRYLWMNSFWDSKMLKPAARVVSNTYCTPAGETPTDRNKRWRKGNVTTSWLDNSWRIVSIVSFLIR